VGEGVALPTLGGSPPAIAIVGGQVQAAAKRTTT